MTAPAGYLARHYISTDGTTFNEVLSLSDVKPGGQKNDMADRTYYGQGDAQKRRSKTLHDNQATIKADLASTDTQLAAIISAGDAGTDIWLKTLYDGTHGWSAKCIVESYDVSPPVNGKVELTATFLVNGPKTTF